MSYGDFKDQLKGRGATEVIRSAEAKATYFEYKGVLYQCLDKNRAVMARELSDGYEMDYCLSEYCLKAQHRPEPPPPREAE